MAPSIQALPLGIILGLCTTFLSALGLVCKKRAHDAPHLRSLRSFQKREWLLGLACLVTSALASLGVSYLLGQALASCMAAVTIVWGVVLRKALLKEPSHRHDLLCSALLTLGVAVVLFSAPSSTPSAADPRAIIADTFATPRAQATVGVCLLLTAALLTAVHAYRCGRGFRPLLLLLLSALLSGATGCFSKALGSLLALAFSGRAAAASVLATPQVYLSLIALVASVVAQLWHLNAALKQARASLIMPLYQALFVLVGVGAGALIWGEGSDRTPVEAGAMAAGLLCIIAGLFVLLAGHGAPQPAAQPPATQAAPSTAPPERAASCRPRRRAASAPQRAPSAPHAASASAETVAW